MSVVVSPPPDFQTLRTWLLSCLEQHQESLDLEKVKELPDFKKIINSPRDYAGVESVVELVLLLEKRNSFHPNCVVILRKLLYQIITEHGSQDWMSQALKLVNSYHESIASSTTGNCLACGTHFACHEPLKSNFCHETRSVEPELCHISRDSQPAVKQISPQNKERSLWDKVSCYCNFQFLRALPGLSEGDINAVRSRYNNELEVLRRCFERWLCIVGDGTDHFEAVSKALSAAGQRDAVSIVFG